MEQLPDPHREWDLGADKQLFAALQQFSASFLTRLKDTEAAVATLAKSVEDADVRARCVHASFRQLANSHYIEQVSGWLSSRSVSEFLLSDCSAGQ